MKAIFEKPSVDLSSKVVRCFALRGNELLIRASGPQAQIPRLAEVLPPSQDSPDRRYVGALGDEPCFLVKLSDDYGLPPEMEFRALRSLFGALPEEEFLLAGRAFQMIQFEDRHRFCGRCGSPTEFKGDEYAKVCPACSLVRYPGVFPAVIMAVVKSGSILLARAHRHPRGLYSVLAGFVEPGETLEGCVAREVREEVGVAVKNIRYFGSQPWPFPNSLMIGFIAEYAGGDIVIDDDEILDAGWFAPSVLPKVPGRPTIARQLIDWFLETSGSA